jgi:hypothetical protein
MPFELSHIKQKRVQYLETLGVVNQCGEYRGRTDDLLHAIPINRANQF